MNLLLPTWDLLYGCGLKRVSQRPAVAPPQHCLRGEQATIIERIVVMNMLLPTEKFTHGCGFKRVSQGPAVATPHLFVRPEKQTGAAG